eukprot:12218892-Karenia_brevis.AAC.1
MAGHAEAAGLLSLETFREQYDLRTERAITRMVEELPDDMHERLRGAIRDASEEAEQWWTAANEGEASAHPPATGGSGLIAGVGEDDLEYPGVPARNLTMRLQARLTWFVDER